MLKEMDVYWLHPADQLLLVGFRTRLKKLLMSTILSRGVQEMVENPVRNPDRPFQCPFKANAVP